MKAHVLIVEDDNSVREFLKRGLEKMGYQPKVAGDAASAIALLQEERFHVVITDKNMPGTDHPEEGGLDVLRFAKKSSPACAVMMITAYATVESASEAMRLGAFDYVSKPIRLPELREKLARIISYQCTLNPADTLAVYEGFWDDILNIFQGQKDMENRLSNETKEQLFTALRQNLDAFFEQKRSRETLLLAQRDALNRIAGWALQLKEGQADDKTSGELLDNIIQETDRRL